MSAFEQATAVTPVDETLGGRPTKPARSRPRAALSGDAAAQPGPHEWLYRACLDPAWTIGGRPNGGYLLATIARAAITTATRLGCPHSDPLAANATYVAAPKPGPAEVITRVHRVGHSVSQVQAELLQAGKILVAASFVLGRLDPTSTPLWNDVPPVELPPIDECPRISSSPGARLPRPIMDLVDARVRPRAIGSTGRDASAVPEVSGWLQFADGQVPDTVSLLYFCDAFPAATRELGSSGWAPTLQITVYVRAVPAGGPLRARQHARLVESGMCDETCEVWDARGRLVAQATQLARVRFDTGRSPR